MTTFCNKQQTLALLLVLFGFGLMLLPELSMAVESSYGPGRTFETDIVTGIRRWWVLISNVAVIGGLAWSAISYFFWPKYLGTAIVVTLIGAFGKAITDKIFQMGGQEVIGAQSSIHPLLDQIGLLTQMVA